MAGHSKFAPPENMHDRGIVIPMNPIVRSIRRWNYNPEETSSFRIASVSSRPSLKLAINGLSIKGLIDTGADVSLCSEETFLKLPVHNRPKLINPYVRLFDAANRLLKCIGLYRASITTAAGTRFHHMYVVRDLGQPAILGWDYLKASKAVINGMDGSVTFPQVSSISQPKPDDTVYLLEACETVVVGPGCTKPITGKITTPEGTQLAPGAEVLVESSPITDLYTPDSWQKVRRDNRLRLDIRNNLPWEIKIKNKSLIPGITVEPAVRYEICEISKAVNAIKATSPKAKIHQLSPEKRKYILSSLNLDGVDKEFRQQYIDFVIRNHDIFSSHKYDIGLAKTTTFNHVIKMKHEDPVFVPQFKIGHHQVEAMEEMVKELLAAKIIVPARSPYNSPMFVVLKKGGGIRFVQDLRAINEASFEDRYSIMDTRKCINAVGHNKPKIMTSLDLTGAYWQLGCSPESQPMTAFTVPSLNAQYQWTRTPMGLKGAPSSFSRYMGYVFRDFKGEVITYLDDALLLSQNHHDHLILLDRVAAVLREENLKLNPKKCIFGVRELTFLGFNVSEHGVSPAKDKLEAIASLPPPKDARQVAEYLGLFNYFRHLVRRFSYLSAPLCKLTSKNSTWKKGELPPEALKAFYDLRSALLAPPVVAFADPSKPFILSTDAAHGTNDRKGGIGAILTQVDDNGLEQLIACFSRPLQEHEQKYSAFEIERLSAIKALEHFDEFVRGGRVTVVLDHKPVVDSSKRRTKTADNLQQKLMTHHVEIQFRKGSENGADALSRTPMASVASVAATSLPDMAKEQNSDPFIKALKRFMKTRVLPEENPTRELVVLLAPKCHVMDGLVWIVENRRGQDAKLRLLLPASQVDRVIRNAHSNAISGHFKLARTIERCLSEYYWLSMSSDVAKFIQRCHQCSITSDPKARQTRSELHPWPQSFQFNNRVHVDLIGPLKSVTQNHHIVVLSDSFSKWIELVPAPNKEAKTIAEIILNEWILRHGPPDTFVSDGGREFDNKILKYLLELMRSRLHINSPLRPQANGQVERVNRSIRAYLTIFVREDTLDWETYLPSLRYAHNTSINRSTCHTPFYLLYTHDPTLPWTLTQPTLPTGPNWASERYQAMIWARNLVLENNEEARQAYKAYYDKSVKDRPFKIGDRVLVHFPSPKVGTNLKFYRPWRGTYRVNRIGDKGILEVIKITVPANNIRLPIHRDRIRHFQEVDDPNDVEVSLNLSLDNQEEWNQSSQQKVEDLGHSLQNQDHLLDETLSLIACGGQALPNQPDHAFPAQVLPIPPLPPVPVQPVPLHDSVVPGGQLQTKDPLPAVKQPSTPVLPRPTLQTALDQVADQLVPGSHTRRITRHGGQAQGVWQEDPIQGLTFVKKK